MMGRWSELARGYNASPITPTDNRQEPAKRVQSAEKKGIGFDVLNPQEPAQSQEQNQVADFLPLSALTSGKDETPTNKAVEVFLPVSATCRREGIRHDREPFRRRPPDLGPEPTEFGFGGRPVTWTGKVVSLDDWRRLTDWERHGPNGKLWNGLTQKWEQAK
jgi:hypothetical protein